MTPPISDSAAAQRLLDRLDAIGAVLARRGDTLALIGLGSVGNECWRIDAYSDLDFFAIVHPAAKARYVDSLDWLAEAHPLAWHYRNTADGHRALMTDGVFCEFAVFEPGELAAIPYAPGRIVWQRSDATASLARPQRALPAPRAADAAWLVGEALSNLITGLGRLNRGETLSAMRLIQGHAVDRLLELADAEPDASATARDPFASERRLEARRPALVASLARWMQGYPHSAASALAILDHLEEHHRVPAAVAAHLRMLAAAANGG